MPNQQMNVPILLVGTGRCGSTLLYSLLAMHRDLAWVPSWVARFPEAEWLAVANRFWSVVPTDALLEIRGFPKPVEPNALFEDRYPGYFGEIVDDAVIEEAHDRLLPVLARICRWQGRARLLLKMVGRPVKVTLFEALFNAPFFVHITRDLKPTVASLLKVDFFERTGTLKDWRWGSIPTAYIEFHEQSGHAPEVVAAIQYALNRAEIDRQLGHVPSRRKLEIGYIDLVTDPVGKVRAISQLANLAIDSRYEKRLSRRRVYGGADLKWEKELTVEQIRRLDAFEALMIAQQGIAR